MNETMWQEQENPGVGLLELAGDLKISSAQALRTHLIEGLDRFERLEFDLTSVEDCDLTALQLFIALKEAAIKRGKKVCLRRELPQILQEALAQLGLSVADWDPCGPPEEAQ
ncbi:MAG: STAS domain-containing protein [bacterium]|nr:STAS domain-containing protein [bacterium]